MNTKGKTLEIVMCAIISALVLILQLMGAFIKFGPFSVTIVLVPIVVGVASCGKKYGWWFGLVFGLSVLISGDAAPFFTVNPIGTVATVLVKGILCGICAGLVYDAVKNFSRWLAIILAAIVCPVVNTGVFLIGCKFFFMEALSGWAEAAGFGSNVALYMIVVLVGMNFVFEMASNIILSPVIIRLLKIRNKD